jgi:hypothetical protein
MLLFFSNRDTHSENMKKMWYSLFEESSIRKPYWIFHGEECGLKMKKLILKNLKPLINDVYLKRFEYDNSYNIIDSKLFINDITEANILGKIEDIFYSDYKIKSEININDVSDMEEKKEFIRSLIRKNFKILYKLCTKESKNKISDLLLEKKINLQNYFNKMQEEDFKKYEEMIEIRNELYDNCRVNELLKDKNIKNIDEIVKYSFENQKGNKLFIVTFFTAKKIEDKEFMKELEDNYGIYLDVDTFIKEMNQKLNEIKSLNEMYKYIGSEYGQDKTDLEIIIESYEKAKKKGYIREPNERGFRGYQSFREGNIRDRGNLRGFRGGRGRGGRFI